MSDPGGPPRPRRAPLAPPAVELALVERLNQWWRVAGPSLANASWKQRLAYPLRQALARVLGPQETFNSAVVQYVNAATTSQAKAVDHIGDALDKTLDECDAAIDEVRRYKEARGARERRMEAAMTAIRAEHEELRTTIGILQQQLRSDR